MFATKYRPASLKDVVGQPIAVKVVEGLINRFRNGGELPTALIFCGVWGTGKTTLARILAAALNCDTPVGLDACGKCESCTWLLNDQHPDIFEQDAASNRSIDDIARLRDWFGYMTRKKVRVAILDEAHQLTTHAWQSLFKMLEQKIPGMLIFSTTEYEKVPNQIRSRSFEVYLQPVKTKDVANRLKQIGTLEQLTFFEPSYTKIAEVTKGHVRDAVSLLEQLSLLGNADEETISAAAGLIGSKKILPFLSVLTQGPREAIMKALIDLRDEEPTVVVKSCLAYVKDELIRRYNLDRSSYLLPTVSEEILVRIIDFLERASMYYNRNSADIFTLYALLP